MKAIINYILASCIVCFLLTSCSKEDSVPIFDISANELVFDRIGSVQSITVTTDLQPVSCTVPGADWCSTSVTGGKIIIETTTNLAAATRTATIEVSAGNLKKSVSVTQVGFNSYSNDIKDDIAVPVKSGTASSFQPGGEIEKSFDGNFSTIYHSNWTNSASNYFPITLTYNFENASSIDYLVYYPRLSGYNGFFKEFELWVATESDPALKKYGDYNFNGRSSASQINFNPALVKPTAIRFVIKSGVGDGQGFASCSEMKFFRKNPENFDYLTIFTDNSCSELKAGTTEADILKIGNGLFRDLATEIYRKQYDSEFRVQNYKPWQDPNIMATMNRTSTYSLLDNPTGIYTNTGDELIFFASNPGGRSASIRIQDLENGYGGQSYPIVPGLNKINVSSGGLVYVIYHTENATEQSVKINFVTGSVNGYFDSQKHKKDDWARLLGKATYKHFDLVGKYAHLTFPTAKFKADTPDGLALIDKYDELVYREQEFMGLFKYARAFKNRMYFHVDYGDGWMYSTSNRTAYVMATMDGLCYLNKFTTDVWGPAHEVGHSNQTRPGFKWIGMTEVTNNIMSLYIQTSFGNTSRLIAENRYSKARKEIIDGKIAHNASNDVFNKLVPFWQLKLYLQDALGKADFYKDLYEYMRSQNVSGVANDGFYQLDFVRATCRIAKLDLTEFFQAWGFLTPIDKSINDYSTKQFTITQQQIDDLKAEIAAQNYPKPAQTDLFNITDYNVADFK